MYFIINMLYEWTSVIVASNVRGYGRFCYLGFVGLCSLDEMIVPGLLLLISLHAE